nr:3-deoxy-manno-octulosonate cytidylyltransferase, mitochondrial-like [Solanum lycopersicum]
MKVHLAPGSKFNFQKYIKRSLEDDFKVIVGINSLLWFSAVVYLLLNVHVVATDDENIVECCQGFGVEVIMTSKSCRNGTERCNEALQKLGNKYDIVVNIQRDEPLIEPETIVAIVKALQAAPNAVFGTVVMSLKPEDALDPNRVKCVVESRGYAIYFHED